MMKKCAFMLISLIILASSVIAIRELDCSKDFNSCSGLVSYWKLNDQQYDDNFDGASLKTDRWTLNAGTGSIEISDNKLNISASGVAWASSNIYS